MYMNSVIWILPSLSRRPDLVRLRTRHRACSRPAGRSEIRGESHARGSLCFPFVEWAEASGLGYGLVYVPSFFS
jgi:hypothetical protein